MARFTVAVRRALDASHPSRARFLALLWAIDSYGALTGESFHGTFERLGRVGGFGWANKPSDEQITAAVEVLIRERASFLDLSRSFAADRRTQKRERAQRQASKAQLRNLYFAAWFHAPGVHRKASPALASLAREVG
jgi:hypothetical protein